MRLLAARFENFRLLRDLELQLSGEAAKKLTVIRAANETGKTTVLTALQWALYGDRALPRNGAKYRLHPIDWGEDEGRSVKISATVDFEVLKHYKAGRELRESRKRYRIVRCATEELDGRDWRRGGGSVKLFALERQGTVPIEAPETFIEEELPFELRDVFFTDGDRALSFIESDVAVSTKRERVQRAIRSLLGLGVIEDAIKHVKRVQLDVNRAAKQLERGSELAKSAERLDELHTALAQAEQDFEDAKQQFGAFDEQLATVDRSVDQALKKGDREKLARDLEAAKRTIDKLDTQSAAAEKDHATLFRREALARDLLAPVLGRAFSLLGELHDQGKIPNTTIPVVEERLLLESCICGESLDGSSLDGQRRRDHLSRLIESSRKADEVQGIITDLYYGSRSLQENAASGDGTWVSQYAAVAKRRVDLSSLRQEIARKVKGLERDLDAVPDTDVVGLREMRRGIAAQRDKFQAKCARLETLIEGYESEVRKAQALRDTHLRQQQAGQKVLAQMEAAEDVGTVLAGAYRTMTDREVARVSELMNDLFLEMIGADPEQGAIIQRAAIGGEFDIIVTGPGGRLLDPDKDLNGASRRALTLAFILALTHVSQVEAANVIDTPLGMMSGYVKRSVLRVAIRESSQLVLFLTHDEIKGCEEILDAEAGMVFTLTNPAHYPKMLVNDPKVSERRVLLCRCNHRQTCAICERREDEPQTS